MQKIITISIGLLLLLSIAKGQETEAFFQSLEVELEKATFDPARGLGLKLNHVWRSGEHAQLQSGLMLNALLRPGASPATTGTLSEFNSSFRLQFHTGYTWTLGAKKKWYTFLEGFVGLRSYLISGSLDQPSQGFERSFSAFTVRGDAGYRLGVGYQIAPKWGLQVGVTGSILEINHPLNFYTGLLVWGPDSLALLGIGIRYSLN